jgi:hypothetical protein
MLVAILMRWQAGKGISAKFSEAILAEIYPAIEDRQRA